jgi:hypothetical protein
MAYVSHVYAPGNGANGLFTSFAVASRKTDGTDKHEGGRPRAEGNEGDRGGGKCGGAERVGKRGRE